MTLIAVYNTDKKMIGRCDARCYGAKGEDCKCVCSGINHGKGYDEARANTNEHGDRLAREYESQHPEVKVEVK
jgi:alpha-galactosidase/6-phospho-beta-glucosidase family protein